MEDVIIDEVDIVTLDSQNKADNNNIRVPYLNQNNTGNDTSNITGSTIHNVADAEWDKDMRIAALWVEIAIGVVGGLIVCWRLWRERRRPSRVNVAMLHVTVSDLLVMATTLAQVLWEMTGRWWLAGDVMCRVVKFFQSFTMMASSYMLVLLSIDRHQAIRHPLWRAPPIWQMALPFWILAAMLSTPMLFLFRVSTITDETSIFHNMTVCESLFRYKPILDRQVFLTTMSIFHIFLPSLAIAICYIRIFLKISRKAGESGCASNVVARPGKFQLQSTRSSSLPRAKIKTLKMTLVIVTLFIVCGLPYHILEMMYNFWSHVKVHKTASAILGALPVANSVVNPYIYLAFNNRGMSTCQCGGCCADKTNSQQYSDYRNNTSTTALTQKTNVYRYCSDYNSTAIMEMTRLKK